MNTTIRGHNLRVTMAIVALAVVLFVLTLFAVVQTTSTTSDSGDANPAMSAEGKRGSGVTYDTYMDRHRELVHRMYGGSHH